MLAERADHVLWAELGEQVVLLEPNGSIHRLNAAGAALWQRLDGVRTLAEIASELAVRFSAPQAEIEADLEMAIEAWNALGISAPPGSDRQASDNPHQQHPQAALNHRQGPLLHLPNDVAWAASLGPYQGLGFRFQLQVEDGELGKYLGAVLEPLHITDATSEPLGVCSYAVRLDPSLDAWVVYVDGSSVFSSASVCGSADFLLWHINQRVIDSADGRLCVHSGAVEVDGAGILLAGGPNAGKSTLVTALIKSGCGYLSDEVGAIDLERSELVAFPRAIGLDEGSWRLFPEFTPPAGGSDARFVGTRWHVPSERVRSTSTRSVVPLSRIVDIGFVANGDTVVAPLAPADRLELLLRQSFPFRWEPLSFKRLARIARNVAGFRLRFDSLDTAVAVIRDL